MFELENTMILYIYMTIHKLAYSQWILVLLSWNNVCVLRGTKYIYRKSGSFYGKADTI